MKGPETHGLQSHGQSENRYQTEMGGASPGHAAQQTELIHVKLTLDVLAIVPDILQNTAVLHLQNDTGDK